nr:hypothetical protein [Candidatus Sigynarchaeota archaeon]
KKKRNPITLYELGRAKAMIHDESGAISAFQGAITTSKYGDGNWSMRAKLNIALLRSRAPVTAEPPFMVVGYIGSLSYFQANALVFQQELHLVAESRVAWYARNINDHGGGASRCAICKKSTWYCPVELKKPKDARKISRFLAHGDSKVICKKCAARYKIKADRDCEHPVTIRAATRGEIACVNQMLINHCERRTIGIAEASTITRASILVLHHENRPARAILMERSDALDEITDINHSSGQAGEEIADIHVDSRLLQHSWIAVDGLDEAICPGSISDPWAWHADESFAPASTRPVLARDAVEVTVTKIISRYGVYRWFQNGLMISPPHPLAFCRILEKNIQKSYTVPELDASSGRNGGKCHVVP